jgi:hypothetical protein
METMTEKPKPLLAANMQPGEIDAEVSRLIGEYRSDPEKQGQNQRRIRLLMRFRLERLLGREPLSGQVTKRKALIKAKARS